ncbi:MAG: hypothetical protein K8W52_34715 [Deltaproteobacteria bacterium]|nr:hypothetical protein [Deltaproteobacteria bacterium]
MSSSSRIALIAMLVGCGARSAPPAPAPAAAPTAIGSMPDAAPVAPADRDGDGITDDADACPDQPMVMSAGCDAARQHGCPDDCRPPTMIAP